MSCEAHMCKVVELSLCANFLNTDPYTRVLKRWLVYAGCDCLTMFICFCAFLLKKRNCFFIAHFARACNPSLRT